MDFMGNDIKQENYPSALKKPQSLQKVFAERGFLYR
jgi:hypothetical protein